MKKVPFFTKKRDTQHKFKGYSLVEILLAMSIIIFIIGSLSGALINSTQNSINPGQEAVAINLAQEGLEATRSIRNENFSNLTDGTHGLSVVASKWSFAGTNDAIDGYTRSIEISAVNPTTKLISVQVEWNTNLGLGKSINIDAYLSDIYRVVIPPADWSNPGLSTSLDLSGNANTIDIDVQGNYAYLLRPPTEDLVIINISNPDSPIYVSSYSITGSSIAIDVEGSYAYITSDSNTEELIILDITNPLAVSTVGTLNLTGNQDPTRLFHDNDKIYLTRTNNGSTEFYIIDVGTPATPLLLGGYEISGGARDIFWMNNKAYIASSANNQEMLILDVTNPVSIIQLSALDLPGNNDAQNITGFTNTILISQAGGDLYTIDVTNTLSPSISGSFDAGADINKISINGSHNLAFVASSNTTQEFQVIDISNLALPLLYGSLNLSQDATSIKYVDSFDRAFLSNNSNSEELIVLKPQ